MTMHSTYHLRKKDHLIDNPFHLQLCTCDLPKEGIILDFSFSFQNDKISKLICYINKDPYLPTIQIQIYVYKWESKQVLT